MRRQRCSPQSHPPGALPPACLRGPAPDSGPTLSRAWATGGLGGGGLPRPLSAGHLIPRARPSPGPDCPEASAAPGSLLEAQGPSALLPQQALSCPRPRKRGRSGFWRNEERHGTSSGSGAKSLVSLLPREWPGTRWLRTCSGGRAGQSSTRASSERAVPSRAGPSPPSHRVSSQVGPRAGAKVCE